jgi:acyl carrier protein phosphodiesterase
MNYLAHMFLSFDEPDIITGNFLGDMISNKDVKTYPEGIRKGVFIHRQIDTFTDDHPEVLKGVRRLYKNHSKYASVLIDIYYDYILALNWPTYTNETMQDFADRIYKALQSNLSLMPDRVQRHLQGMVSGNWLLSYANLGGIQYAIDRMKMRASKPELFAGAVESLESDLDLLNDEFNIFFPEIIVHIQEQLPGN